MWIQKSKSEGDIVVYSKKRAANTRLKKMYGLPNVVKD